MRAKELVDDLARYECPGITARAARFDGEDDVARDPLVIAKAKGETVWDADGKEYIDAGAFFAVSAYGHCNDELQEALTKQAALLMHGMGDVYPSEAKIAFLKRLASFCPGNLNQSILSQSGAEAVESALKTAQIVTGKSKFVAFEGSYHGLSYGALSLTSHSPRFTAPFASRISAETSYVPYPYALRLGGEEKAVEISLENVRRELKTGNVAAVVAEPLQGRGGDIVPPAGWLKSLRELTLRYGALLILDEIYVGLGRSGFDFACDAEDVVPDLLCLGKALTGGFPMSACVGSEEIMRKWGLNTSEAIHTSTYLGNPMGCAVANKALEILQRDRLAERSLTLGHAFMNDLKSIADKYPDRIAEVRGRGLMIGIELVKDRQSLSPDTALSLSVVEAMRDKGVIMLCSGKFAQTLSFSPPLTISEHALCEILNRLDDTFREKIGSSLP